jgi:hypothetical protein
VSAHRCLTIDGELSGTRVRDAVDGGSVELHRLELSPALAGRIVTWATRYADSHHVGFPSSDVAALDAKGIEITRAVRRERPDSTVAYVSATSVRTLLHSFEA